MIVLGRLLTGIENQLLGRFTPAAAPRAGSRCLRLAISGYVQAIGSSSSASTPTGCPDHGILSQSQVRSRSAWRASLVHRHAPSAEVAFNNTPQVLDAGPRLRTS